MKEAFHQTQFQRHVLSRFGPHAGRNTLRDTLRIGTRISRFSTPSIVVKMRVNADFSQKVIIHSDAMEWIASPMPGVERKMLDRLGAEVARATSIVKYAPGSSFARHTHGGGEEYLVLEGTFQDDTGDFPEGHYVRNPPQSAHTPSSDPGCTIFVKLWQMDPNDRMQVDVDLSRASLRPGTQAGVQAATIFENGEECVEVQQWAPGAQVCLPAPGGLELLLLKGAAEDKGSGEHLRRGSWVRVPCNESLQLSVGKAGAYVWLKEGHLAAPRGL